MSDILHATESLCPICLKKIPARYLQEDGKVYFCKECPEHGPFKVLFWNDAEMYRQWMEQGVYAPTADRKSPALRGCPYDCGLCNEHRSGTCTSILEITYRCNMRCNICFADANAERFEPDMDTVRRMYAAALGSNRFCSVQLSGGEPTLRDDLPEIIRLGKELGVIHLQVNTNGIRIAEDPEFLRAMKVAGLDLIYLQFDGTDDSIYQTIRGRDMMQIKRRAIQNCAAVGIGVLLVPVVIPGANLHRLDEIVDFAKGCIPTVKGIHFQPVSYFGRYPGQTPPDESRCGLSDVIHALTEQCEELELEHFVPRKQFDPHCDFSSTYYLNESGRLVPMTNCLQNTQDTEQTDFVTKTNCYTDKRWRLQQDNGDVDSPSPLLAFARRTMTHSFSISGMGFQDVWNLDLGRLKGCCVHMITGKGQVIPFCAFHLTGEDGKRLYTN